jgi:hypothetical protein
VNARILSAKSANRASISQMTMNQFYPHAICKDSYDCFSRRADWICSQVHSDESTENVDFPSGWDPVEKSQVASFDVVLIYFVSASAGDQQAIILDERCSVTCLLCAMLLSQAVRWLAARLSV